MAKSEVERILKEVVKHNFSAAVVGSGSRNEPTEGKRAEEELTRQVMQAKSSEMYIRSLATQMIRDVTQKGAQLQVLHGVVERRDHLLKEQRTAYLKELLHLREIVRQFRTTGRSTLADVYYREWEHDEAAEQQVEEENQKIDAALQELKTKYDDEKTAMDTRHAKVVDDLKRTVTLLEVQVAHLTVPPPLIRDWGSSCARGEERVVRPAS